MAKSAITIKGAGIVASGFLDTEKMTLESEEFAVPVKLSKLCDMAGLDNAYVKVVITEADTPVSESDLAKVEEESEDEE
jgi:hypothetical protein|nr:MAG TPA: hypothetical protein [Caudoviricetes sp.]